MSSSDGRLSCDLLLDYFVKAAVPSPEWRVGMELEKIGRRRTDGRPIPYDGEEPNVRSVLEFLLDRRGGRALHEEGRIIGIRAPWGSITLEPGGQVEWSSAPLDSLGGLESAFEGHLEVMRQAGSSLGIEWLDDAVDPVHPVADMPWMPKQRYRIMRDYFRRKGRLAHRMMTQTASIQCAYDYGDPNDWVRKFRAAAILAPVATAMFANSPRIDGVDTGYRSYRQMIWRETDDDRCGLPAIVFDDGFDIERWIHWLLDVPLLFRRRGETLIPPDGSTFRQLLQSPEGESVNMEDWTTHCSSIFTEVRCYTYMEVRSADLQPDERAFAVPTFWTATLYDDDALDAALEVGAGLDHEGWLEAMDSAARHGIDGVFGRSSLRDVASRALTLATRALRGGSPCSGDGSAVRHLEQLASRLALDVKV